MRKLGGRSVKNYIRDRQRRGHTINTHELSACYGKIRHSKIEARERAEELPDVRAYKCRFCEYWHIGGKK